MLDTAADWCLIPPDIAASLGCNMEPDPEVAPLSTRFGLFQGRLERLTLEVYRRGAELAAERGVLVADTKLEFGHDAQGRLLLGDELLTPDSSRFWDAAQWRPGGPQRAFDKQFVRDWSSRLDWDRTPPGPEIPPEIVAATRARYAEALGRLTGTRGPEPG